jgi:hypothetical protein
MSVPPCGASPLAGWAPDEIEAPVNAARLADKLSPQTGEMTLLEGEHPVDASIAFAFRAVFGSGIALGRKGNKFGTIKKNDRNASASIAHEAQRVMKPFVDGGLAVVLRIRASTDRDNGGVTTFYRNLLTGKDGQWPPPAG